MLMLSVHHHDPCDRPGLLVYNHWCVNTHWSVQAVKGLCCTLQLAIAFHCDPVARQHLAFCHPDCHQKAKQAAFVLLVSPFMLFLSPFVLVVSPFVLLLSPVVLLLTPFHKQVC